MANWFGKGKRGLIMGVWNAHTSVGECWARRQGAQHSLSAVTAYDAWQPIPPANTSFCQRVEPSLHPLIRSPHPRLAHPCQSFNPTRLSAAPPAGNIIGSLIAASMLKHGWGWSFVVPGAFIALCGAQQG
jgi:hypothetical protein